MKRRSRAHALAPLLPILAGLGCGADEPIGRTVVTDSAGVAMATLAVDDTLFGMLTGRRSSAAEDPPIPAGQVLWRLVSATGRYAGVIRYPPGFTPWWVEGGRVLGVARDSLDVATIQEYALEPPRRHRR